MIFAALVVVVIGLAYFLNNYWFSYWSRKGFEQLNPKLLVGDAGPMFTLKESMGEYFAKVYNKFKSHKIVGIYLSYRPALLITDAKLVQDIMIRDFTSFHDRPMPVDEVNDPLSGHLFNIAGQKWRDLRVKLSPTFTSGKLKGMFSIIKDCTKTLEDYLVKNVNQGVDVFEFRDLMARFNTNIISSVAFGIENDCINNPDHIFRKMGAKVFEPSFANAFRGVVALFWPKLFHLLKLKVLDKEVDDFIFSVVKQTVEYREQKNFTRNDFMQLLIQLKNQGYISVDKNEKEAEEVKDKNVNKMTINELAAQVFVFFVAGFETSSSTLSYCLFELARNIELQRKVQEDIDKVFKATGPDGFTYDLLGELKYVECCIDETLRKYPIVPVHMRTATKDYKVDDTDLVIPKGTAIFIPALGFQRDPNIYDNPMEFKPERFLNSSHGGGHGNGVFYTPFGDGPRNCIGMRMGKLTTKIGLSLILSKFNLELTDKEMIDKELDFHPNQFVLTPQKLFNIKISPR